MGGTFALADPRGAPGTRAPPWGSKFFHFHAVFGKKLKNNSTFGSWRPPWGKSWIRHCFDLAKLIKGAARQRYGDRDIITRREQTFKQ